MYTCEELNKANACMKTTDIKGKDYVEVNERIRAFRSVCPHGAIVTELLSDQDGVCVFRASVYDEEKNLLGTGTAKEKETSSYINKTSYIENCETSAVGRALGMCGFGIGTSVASYEEVTNAINNQHTTVTEFPGAVPYNKPQSIRQQLFAKLKEKGIDAAAWAADNGVDKSTPDAELIELLNELED